MALVFVCVENKGMVLGIDHLSIPGFDSDVAIRQVVLGRGFDFDSHFARWLWLSKPFWDPILGGFR